MKALFLLQSYTIFGKRWQRINGAGYIIKMICSITRYVRIILSFLVESKQLKTYVYASYIKTKKASWQQALVVKCMAFLAWPIGYYSTYHLVFKWRQPIVAQMFISYSTSPQSTVCQTYLSHCHISHSLSDINGRQSQNNSANDTAPAAHSPFPPSRQLTTTTTSVAGAGVPRAFHI